MFEIIFLLFVFVLVIGLAYFGTKKIASIGNHRMQGKNMEIIESQQLSMNQAMHLVRVGEKMIIVGVSKENITYLSEIDIESIDLEKYKRTEETPSFEDYFKRMLNKRHENK